MNHLALIEKTTSLIAAGDIVGAESALADLADEEGDRALMAFAQAIKGQLRASDAVGRLGGEEFGVLLPVTTLAEGLEVATRMLHSIRALELTDDAGHSYRVTTSLGVSTFRQSDRSLRDMLDRADQALYLAKHRGRNQVASLETLGE